MGIMPDLNPFTPPAAVSETPHRAAADLRTALIGARFQATLVDSVLSFVVILPVLIIGASTGSSGSGLGIIVIATVTAFWLYQWYLVSTTGQTLGKRWVGIRIVKLDGSPLTFMSGVVLRSWVFALLSAVPGIGALLALADILAILGNDRRCLHDHLAGTKVVVT